MTDTNKSINQNQPPRASIEEGKAVPAIRDLPQLHEQRRRTVLHHRPSLGYLPTNLTAHITWEQSAGDGGVVRLFVHILTP